MAEDVRHAIPCDELRRLRLDCNMTVGQLAAHYGCGNTTIQRRCAECDIPKRGGITAAQMGKRANLDAARLRELYVDRRLSEKEVGDIMGCDRRTVRQELQRHGIGLRPRGGAPPHKAAGLADDELHRLAVIEKRSDAEIGRMFGVSGGAIFSRRKRRGMHKTRRDIDAILTRECLEAEYGKKRRSADQIAEETGLGSATIYDRLKKYGIPMHEDHSPERGAYLRQCRERGRAAQERMIDLLGGRCSICETTDLKQRHIHHMWYYPQGDAIYDNYKKIPGLYHMKLLPLVEREPDRFMLLCQSCHYAVGKLEATHKHSNLDRFIDVVGRMDAERAVHMTTFEDCVRDVCAGACGVRYGAVAAGAP